MKYLGMFLRHFQHSGTYRPAKGEMIFLSLMTGISMFCTVALWLGPIDWRIVALIGVGGLYWIASLACWAWAYHSKPPFRVDPQATRLRQLVIQLLGDQSEVSMRSPKSSFNLRRERSTRFIDGYFIAVMSREELSDILSSAERRGQVVYTQVILPPRTGARQLDHVLVIPKAAEVTDGPEGMDIQELNQSMPTALLKEMSKAGALSPTSSELEELIADLAEAHPVDEPY